jgi:hypothetical protein
MALCVKKIVTRLRMDMTSGYIRYCLMTTFVGACVRACVWFVCVCVWCVVRVCVWFVCVCGVCGVCVCCVCVCGVCGVYGVCV